MPLPIQLGDIANRLRRAFDIRGRIPTALDETIVPVTLVRDSSVLPFALDPAEGAGFIELLPTAGQQATIALVNEGPPGSVFMLDEVHLAGSAAGGRVEVSRSGVVQTDGVRGTEKLIADMSTSCLGLTTALNLPVRMIPWTTAPAATGGAIAQQFRVLVTHQGYCVKAMLRRGEVLYFKNQAVTTELYVTVRGRFFTQITVA